MATCLSKDVYELLEKAVSGKIENYILRIHESNQKGEGLAGAITYISLKPKIAASSYYLVIKEITPNPPEHITSSYFSEIYFYTKIIPAFQEFQKLYPGYKFFPHIPKCFATISDVGKEKLALENLRFDNFEMHPKKEPIDLKTFEPIFKIYGELHGLSFAYKHYHFEKFTELCNPLKNNFMRLIQMDITVKAVLRFCQKIKEHVDEGDNKEFSENYQKFFDNRLDIFKKSADYKGRNAVILHGDCWSNNMMFKYNSSREVINIKLLDFQMTMPGSPVLDLSYALYSGGSKKVYDNLELLLVIYYNSLTQTLKQFRCDVREIFPYETLKEEWKEYCVFGYIQGILIWNAKFTENISEVPDFYSEGDKNKGEFIVKMDEDNVKKATLELTKHMFENGFL